MSFSKFHSYGFIIALICGGVIFLPQLWTMQASGNDYAGVPLSYVDNDVYYLTRVAVAYRGDFGITQGGMAGSRGEPYTNLPLGENTVAFVAKILGLTPAQMSVAGYFLFPALLALVFYFLFYLITGSRKVAVLAPLAIVLGGSVVMEPDNLRWFFSAPQNLWASVFNRPIHPQISSLYFYSWLLCFASYMFAPRRWKFWITGALFGLLFYVYPYAWTTAAATLGVMFVILLLQKQWQKALEIFYLGLIGGVISLGYWWNAYQLSIHPLYEVIKQRLIFHHSRDPIFSWLLALDLILLCLIYWRRQKTDSFYLVLSVLLALAIALNQQIITGIKMYPGHWHWYYVVPLTAFLLVWALGAITDRLGRGPSTAAFSLVALAILYFGYVSQWQYFNRYKDTAIASQKLVPIYNWFAATTSPGSVVLASFAFTDWLTFVSDTHRYSLETVDDLYLITDDQIKHNAFVKFYFQGARADNIDQFINYDALEVKILHKGLWRKRVENCQAWSECFRPEELAQLKNEYLEFLQKDIVNELKAYRLDYIVKMPEDNFMSDFARLPYLEKVAIVRDVEIYRVK